jgi:hypothetical protein
MDKFHEKNEECDYIIDLVNKSISDAIQFEKERVFSAFGGILTDEEIQQANALHFKRNSKIPLSENKKQEIINNIKNLDVGTVEYIRVSWLGNLIEVTLKDK